MNKKLKGFTLTELIVVIAVIGILSAILIPSWMNWLANSKIKKQNNNARVIFNAAQTVVQDYKFKERKLNDSAKNVGNGDFYFYWDKDTGASASGDANATDTDFINDFTKQINRIYGDQQATTYRIYVNNYMVKSVVSASDNTNRHKGSYPVKQEGTNTTDIQSFDMTAIEYTETT